MWAKRTWLWLGLSSAHQLASPHVAHRFSGGQEMRPCRQLLSKSTESQGLGSPCRHHSAPDQLWLLIFLRQHKARVSSRKGWATPQNIRKNTPGFSLVLNLRQMRRSYANTSSPGEDKQKPRTSLEVLNMSSRGTPGSQGPQSWPGIQWWNQRWAQSLGYKSSSIKNKCVNEQTDKRPCQQMTCLTFPHTAFRHLQKHKTTT